MKQGGSKSKRPEDIPIVVRINLTSEESKHFHELMDLERRGSGNMATILIVEALAARGKKIQ